MRIRKIIAFTLSAAMLGTGISTTGVAQDDNPSELIQLADGTHNVGESYGFWYNGMFGENGAQLIADRVTGAYISREVAAIDKGFDFTNNGRNVSGRFFSETIAPEIDDGHDDTYGYEYSYYVGKVKVSDIINLKISATVKDTSENENIWVHFENVGPVYDTNGDIKVSSENKAFIKMMSEAKIKQSNAEIVFNKANKSGSPTTVSYDIYKSMAVLQDNSSSDKDNVVTVTQGDDITLSKLRDSSKGYIDSEGYTYIYVSSKYEASIKVEYSENPNPGQSGIQLNGTDVESFESAMSTIDNGSGEYELDIYSDISTNQNNQLRTNPVTVSIKNGSETATIKQTKGNNPIIRTITNGTVLNLGKKELTETNEGTALVLSGDSRARILEVQGKSSTVNLYHGTVLKNGNGSGNRGGAVDVKENAIFNIYGGLIKDNKSSGDIGGGGVSMLGTSKVYMTDGMITGNADEKGNGGGVAVLENSKFYMSGGMIINNAENDVYLKFEQGKNSAFYMSGSAYAGTVRIDAGKVINVNGAFTKDMVHAIIKPSVYTEGMAVVKYDSGLTPNPNDFFVASDGEQAYELEVNGQELVLKKCDRTYLENLYLTASTYPDVSAGANYIKNAISVTNADGLNDNAELIVTDGAHDDFTMSWSSSNESLITSDGVITRPEYGRAKAILTLTVTFKGNVTTRDIPVVINGVDAYDYELDITNNKGVDLDKGMYGIFYEDINGAGDGGLFAELIENQSFEAREIFYDDTYSTTFDGLCEWTTESGNTMKIGGTVEGDALHGDEGDVPIHPNNPHFMKFTGTSFQNAAFDGVYMEGGKDYKVSFWAKADDYNGKITVSVGENSAEIVSSGVTNEWKKYEGTIVNVKECRNQPFVVTLSDSTKEVHFDMFSLMPSDAALGFLRNDLYQNLKDLSPGFVRFPGGCVVEGTSMECRYQWKNTVGSIETRKALHNTWGKYRGKMDHYMHAIGFGFYEMFLMCEGLEAKPLPIINVGLSCQNAYSNRESLLPRFELGTPEFEQLVQDAVDLIEFANSTDFENSEWARLRRDMGHPEPFNMEMLGLGNEQWNSNISQYYARCEAFEKKVHEVYPEIKLIDCAHGNRQSAIQWAVNKNAQNPNFVYAVDEHNFNSSNYFFTNNDHFDNYDRSVKIYSGEFAARTSERTGDVQNCLDTGLAFASYMTGMERNGDVVKMVSYAPLHSRIGYTQWTTNLVYYNDKDGYRTPEYYAQMMFANNMGDYIIKSDLNKVGVDDDLVFQTVSYNEQDKDIIVKLINANTYEQATDFKIDSQWNVADNAQAELTVMTGDALNSKNSIEDPLAVSPKSSTISVSSSFRYTIPAQSVVVMRIPVSDEEPAKEILDDIVVEDGVLKTLSVNLPEDTTDAVLYAVQYNDDNTLSSVKAVEAKPETELNVAIEKASVTLMLWDAKQNPVVEKKVINK